MYERAYSYILAAGLALAAATASAEVDLEAAEKLNTEVCAACHGAKGVSSVAEWPSHAGQHADYIRHQLELFRDENRYDPQNLMTSNAVGLSDQDIRNIAAWLAQQEPPKPAEGVDPALAEQGERIYYAGIPEEGVAACTACHGPNGEGIQGAQFPRVAAQQQTYLVNSLKAFKSRERKSDRNAMMRDIAGRMSAEQIEAVSAYMSTLGGEPQVAQKQ
ncbi:c-type cytochrome [Halorhodospira neutriphila]|uniref:Cytochrome c domain-containing protein n=1 Tax=Halorhodospira neutriphila TaxID=168379 RepID=A0ABS1E230_9GAMM|nr:c-type cytochrome [Halorhodospira neutriphila]MBK1725528.1 hypothetical protein [Halorhodospira neutriphila]